MVKFSVSVAKNSLIGLAHLKDQESCYAHMLLFFFFLHTHTDEGIFYFLSTLLTTLGWEAILQ